MIQRIQTLFLLGAFACLGVLFLIPLGHLVIPSGEITHVLDFNYNGITAGEYVENDYTVLPLTILMAITAFITLVSIFMYKNRVLQMRLNGINIFLMLGQIGVFFYYFLNAAKQVNAEIDFPLASILPLAAIIFTYLAIRAIGRDEALVKAADRIR